MNRSKRGMSKQTYKKMQKEIRLAQSAYPVPEERRYSDELTPNEALKKYPKKVAERHQSQLESMQQGFQKKQNTHKKSSKRTTPGTVASDSTPAHIHPEGKRWGKTVVKQNLIQRDTLSRRLSKRK